MNKKLFLISTICNILIFYLLTVFVTTEYLNEKLVNGKIEFLEVFKSLLLYSENMPLFLSAAKFPFIIFIVN